ncbi:MAG: dTDP-glucose 4,6-dehydratase [Bacteroidetes bacterium]|nr:dTDP-glucose 4,6-dehydratase [Bacteroidota bacterium]
MDLRRLQNVLVTGGAGFIGSNYLNRVVKSHPEVHFVNVDALTYAGNLENLSEISGRSNYSFELGNITDLGFIESIFKKYPIDAVVHFAAESHVDRSILDPTAFVKTNVDGTLVLLQVAKTAWKEGKGFFHHVSTDEVFGSLGHSGVFTLDSPYAPRSPYAASKASADHLVRSFGTTYGFPFVITNTSNNYGPYQFPEKLIPLVLNNARTRKPIPIYGKGENVRDWLYVEDHCEALEKVLTRGQVGQTYLIGGSEESSNLDLVESLLEVFDDISGHSTGHSAELITFVQDRAGHDFRYAIDSSFAQKELDWRPRHTLRDGLKKTVTWYLEHPDWLSNILNESYRTYYQTQYVNR